MQLFNGRVIFIGCVISIAILLAIVFYHPTPRLALPTPLTYKIKPSKIVLPVEFEDVASELGITAEHKQSSQYLSALNETLGGGVCTIDVNRDGWLDLLLVGGSGYTREYGKKSWWNKGQGNRLLLNHQGEAFEDITGSSGLQIPMWGMGCAVADFNNDGFSDLIITGVGNNRLFKNNKDSSFKDVTQQSGILIDSWSTGASVADFNNDGLVDIYISNYIIFNKTNNILERNTGFLIKNKTAFDQTLYDAGPNRLYLNQGGFRFSEVAKEMRVENSLGRSLGAKWVDINEDNWPDLLVINDHDTPNQLFINQQGKAFTRASEVHNGFEVSGAHDVLIEHFDNSAERNFLMTRSAGHPPVFIKNNFRNNLFDYNPTRMFQDIAWSSGIATTESLALSSWGAVSADFNASSVEFVGKFRLGELTKRMI